MSSEVDSRCSRGRSSRVVLAVVGILLLTPSEEAGAHAAFVSSEPAPGAELSAAPAQVVLRFTEPLNVELSRVVVTDPDGEQLDGSAVGEHEMRVRVTGNAPGVYDVAWTTVSTVDGHTLHGSFQFGVGVAPGPGAEGSTGTTPGTGDLLIAMARTAEYIGLLLAVGMLLIGALGRRTPLLTWVRPKLWVALAIALIGGLTVVIAEALSAAARPTLSVIAAYLTGGTAGTARIVRIAAEGLALAAWRAVPAALAPLVGVAFVALAAAGHAAAVQPVWAGIGADTIHLAAAGLWAGGILALALLRPHGGWRSEEAAMLVRRFSPWAIGAFLVTVASGSLRGVQELSTLSDLVTTPYGQILSLKVLGVLLMVPLSLLTWRRIAPSPRGEGLLAIAVIAAAAVLAAFPLPPGRAGEAEQAVEQPATDRALPRAGDLTLGGDAGTTLVALTLRPGEPGENQAFVYLLPLEGEEAAKGVPATLILNGTSTPMRDCGLTCRIADVRVEGGEGVLVHVGGGGGGTASFVVPPLPAPDATAIVEETQERMHGLSTYRVREVLGPVDPPYRAVYSFEAPDRFRVTLMSGADRIQIGDVQWRRDGPGQPWRKDSAARLGVPRFIWDGSDFSTARVVRRGQARGATEISFLGGTGTPIWFTLHIDSSGMVGRAEMRAQGHFMDHRYFAFDAPFHIEPPGRSDPR